MLMIDCPYCGPRAETEYTYGGQAHVNYPEDPQALTDEQWAEYVFYRDNPKGSFYERWAHTAGCRKWFNVLRDTQSYTISTTYRLTDPKPELPQPPAVTPMAAPQQSGPHTAGGKNND